MRVFVQRVLEASVSVNDSIIGQIQQGYVLLVGFTHSDTHEEIKYCAKKVANLRIFSDSNDKMNLSIKEVGGNILSISQFTLYGNTAKGNRPSFVEALNPEIASDYYDYFNDTLKKEYGLLVETGQFGADMKVSLVNDGPVSIMIESK